jgi:predicted SprT family Zn-dependent metalloprotease
MVSGPVQSREQDKMVLHHFQFHIRGRAVGAEWLSASSTPH